jgi:hypothetical protein
MWRRSEECHSAKHGDFAKRETTSSVVVRRMALSVLFVGSEVWIGGVIPYAENNATALERIVSELSATIECASVRCVTEPTVHMPTESSKQRCENVSLDALERLIYRDARADFLRRQLEIMRRPFLRARLRQRALLFLSEDP